MKWKYKPVCQSQAVARCNSNLARKLRSTLNNSAGSVSILFPYLKTLKGKFVWTCLSNDLIYFPPTIWIKSVCKSAVDLRAGEWRGGWITNRQERYGLINNSVITRMKSGWCNGEHVAQEFRLLRKWGYGECGWASGQYRYQRRECEWAWGWAVGVFFLG